MRERGNKEKVQNELNWENKKNEKSREPNRDRRVDW